MGLKIFSEKRNCSLVEPFDYSQFEPYIMVAGRLITDQMANSPYSIGAVSAHRRYGLPGKRDPPIATFHVRRAFYMSTGALQEVPEVNLFLCPEGNINDDLSLPPSTEDKRGRLGSNLALILKTIELRSLQDDEYKESFRQALHESEFPIISDPIKSRIIDSL
jgi:hypothetical protein